MWLAVVRLAVVRLEMAGRKVLQHYAAACCVPPTLKAAHQQGRRCKPRGDHSPGQHGCCAGKGDNPQNGSQCQWNRSCVASSCSWRKDGGCAGRATRCGLASSSAVSPNCKLLNTAQSYKVQDYKSMYHEKARNVRTSSPARDCRHALLAFPLVTSRPRSRQLERRFVERSPGPRLAYFFVLSVALAVFAALSARAPCSGDVRWTDSALADHTPQSSRQTRQTSLDA